MENVENNGQETRVPQRFVIAVRVDRRRPIVFVVRAARIAQRHRMSPVPKHGFVQVDIVVGVETPGGHDDSAPDASRKLTGGLWGRKILVVLLNPFSATPATGCFIFSHFIEVAGMECYLITDAAVSGIFIFRFTRNSISFSTFRRTRKIFLAPVHR